MGLGLFKYYIKLMKNKYIFILDVISLKYEEKLLSNYLIIFSVFV